MALQLVESDLERLHGLWEDGLSEAYRSYLEVVDGFESSVQPRLALAAALVEMGVRLQGLGGRAAAPPSLLMGDLCLARASRLLADAAPQSIQVAFAHAIETISSAAASEQVPPHTRELLLRALEAR